MLFSSPIFLFWFLPLTLLIYFAAEKIFKYRLLGNFILLLASLLFYAWGEGTFVFYILTIIAINYIFGRLLSGKYFHHPFWLAIAVFVNLSFLIYYKYLTFLLTAFSKILSLANLHIQPPADIAMPLGISFVTFHVLSYLFDVYRGNLKPERNIYNLALYILLFPHLIAGPIVRYLNIGEQIKKRVITLSSVEEGADRFIFGLGKKVIIANTLAGIADRIFSLFPHQVSPEILWLGILAYTLQIYFDFSGYSDMAIGLAKIFGFHFNENFNHPYISTSVGEFWRRWHMTLSAWFRDYVYIPLGGSRKGHLRTSVNIMTVFFLTGFWHGANWNFIFWGLYYGVFLVAEKVLIGEKLLNSVWWPVRYLYTLLVIMVGWLIFRVENLSYAFYLLKVLFGLTPTYSSFNINMYISGYSLFILVIALLLSFPIRPKLENVSNSSTIRALRISALRPVYLFASTVFLLLIFFYSVMQLASGTYNPFIYFRF